MANTKFTDRDIQSKVKQVLIEAFKEQEEINWLTDVFPDLGFGGTKYIDSIATFSLSHSGFYNYHTHRRFGVVPLVVKTGNSICVRLATKEELIISDLADKFYKEESYKYNLEDYQSSIKAKDDCLRYIIYELVKLNKVDLIEILPFGKKILSELEETRTALEDEKTEIENRINQVEEEVSRIERSSGRKDGTWYCMVSEYFGAEQVDMGIVEGDNSVDNRRRKHNSDASCGDYYILDTIWCKDVRKLEDIIKASYPFWRCSNANTGRAKEVWNFETRDLGIINNIILPHARLLANKINNS